MQRTHSLPTYRLYGQVRAPCSKNGHWRIRFLDIDPRGSRKKLESISVMLEGKMTTTGLVVPDSLAESYSFEHKPFSADEFVVKIPPTKKPMLPSVDSFVDIDVQPVTYKFEKDNKKYSGWNLLLKKVTITEYKQNE